MFVALRPPAAQLTALEDFVEAIGIHASGVRLVSPDKWHITLSFMPAVQSGQLEALHDSLVLLAAATPPLELVLREAGSFARAGAATPIWIGVDGDLSALDELAAGCRTAGHRSGIRVDSSKHFRAHLTLSRRRPPEHGARWMDLLDQFRGQPWTVTELFLMESTLGGRGNPALHREVERHTLTG